MIRSFAFVAAATLGSLACFTGTHAAEVGVTIEVSQPGVYGRIDIGRFPQPRVIVPQPIIIAAPPVVVQPQPVYLWVPPGHRKDWRRHCGRYNACGVPVYFVRHDWYDQNVRGRGDDRGDRDDRGRGHDDQRRGRDDHPGKGHGRGRD